MVDNFLRVYGKVCVLRIKFGLVVSVITVQEVGCGPNVGVAATNKIIYSCIHSL